MTIDIKYEHVPMSQDSYGIMMDGMEELSKKYPFLQRADVIFYLASNFGQIQRKCTICLHVDQKILHAWAIDENLEKAAKRALDNAGVQLAKQRPGRHNSAYEENISTY